MTHGHKHKYTEKNNPCTLGHTAHTKFSHPLPSMGEKKIIKVHKNQQCTIPCKHIQIGFKQMQVTINIKKIHGY